MGMTAVGLELCGACHDKIVANLGDRVHLANGLTGTVQSWTQRGVAVWLDHAQRRPTVGGLPVLAVDCGNGDIAAIISSGKAAR